MFGKTHQLNPLQARKRLLLIESDLNRAQLVQECGEIAREVRDWARLARSASHLGTTALSLLAGFNALRSKNTAAATEKPSWWKIILKGAGLVSTLWPAAGSTDKGQR